MMKFFAFLFFSSLLNDNKFVKQKITLQFTFARVVNETQQWPEELNCNFTTWPFTSASCLVKSIFIPNFDIVPLLINTRILFLQHLLLTSYFYYQWLLEYLQFSYSYFLHHLSTNLNKDLLPVSWQGTSFLCCCWPLSSWFFLSKCLTYINIILSNTVVIIFIWIEDPRWFAVAHFRKN